MNKLLILLLWFALGLLNAQNSNEYWERISSPPGGELQLVHTTHGDTIYGWSAYTDDGRQNLYRSSNAGLSWSKIPLLFAGRAISDSIHIGPSGQFFFLETLPAIEKSRLWYSQDEGQHWQLTSSDTLELDDVAETYSGALLGSYLDLDSLHVVRSVDHGASWTPVLAVNGFFDGFLKSFPGQRTVLGGYGGRAYSSYDDGLTWVKMTRNITTDKVAIAPSGTIFDFTNTFNRSTDQGHGFSVMLLNGTFNISTVSSMTFLPNGRILAHYTTTPDTLIYSDDDGLNWQYLNSGINIGELRLEYPVNSSVIAGIFNQSLYRSVDGGQHWTRANAGINHARIEQLKVVNDSTLFVSTFDGLWRTTDGHTWQYVLDKGSYWAFTAGSNQHFLYISKQKRLFSSNDWGATFSDITPAQTVLNPYVFISPGDSILFLGTNQRMLRSTDMGLTWEALAAGVFLNEMQFHPSGRYYGSGNTFEPLYYSDDFGRTWQAFQNLQGQNFGQLDIMANGDVLVKLREPNGDYAWYKSLDNGGHWSRIPSLPANVGNYMVGNSQGHLFNVGFLNLARSVNGGVSWQSIPEPPVTGFNCFELPENQHLYLGTNESGLLRSQNPSTNGAYIRGTVLRDADADCSTPDGQLAELDHWMVEADGDIDFFTTTDSLGRYDLFVDTGLYNLKLRTPQTLWWARCDTNQVVYLPELLTIDTVDFVTAALSECPLMTVNVGVPLLRRCFDNEVYIQYCNQGAENAESAWVDVLLDPYLSFVGASQPHNDLGNNTIRFFVGDVATGDCGQFQLTVHVDCDSTVLGQTHCISAHGFPDTLCTTVPGWSGANIEANVECQDTLLRFELKNTGPVGSKVLDYIIIEDDVVMFQGFHQYGPSENFTIPIPSNGHTWRIESEQEPGHPFSTLALAFEEGCGGFQSLGYINQFTVNGITPSWHQTCVENTGSFDPNDKRGFPLGTGEEHQIRPGQPIDYMIRFQNTGTDTAFTVFLLDTLSAWLDPATVTPGAASHPYTWQISGQGELSFVFSQILLPDSTTNLAGSQGFVTFRVAQRPGVPLGTRIHNQADIYFDFNDPVRTNTTLHTIGDDPLTGTLDLPTAPKLAVAVEVSPNPATEQATFRLAEGAFQSHNLEVYSPLGARVLQTTVTGNAFVLPRRNLPAGAYGWRVTDAHGALTGSGVVVMQ